MKFSFNKTVLFVISIIIVGYGTSFATHIEKEDVRNTKHNLSITGPDQAKNINRNVSANNTDEICIFCHTPHGANFNKDVNPPIWNRFLSEANYTMYDQVWSKSFEGKLNLSPGAPTGYSRLCLSCHDGTIALGTVVNAALSGGGNTDPTSLIYKIVGSPGPGGTMPIGSGAASGDTRRLGTDLTNDHPVSFTFDTSLAGTDGELVDPGALPVNTKRGVDTNLAPVKRFPGDNPAIIDSVQCTSCHNPHNTKYPKFLRASLYQDVKVADHPAGVGDPDHPVGEPILCLFCHDKPGWKNSDGSIDTGGELNTHALSTAKHTPYPPEVDSPGNPYDFDGEHTVSEYACRNCHDPHTVQGATRLHKEGVDSSGNASIESTCYLCHSPNTGGTALVAGTTVNPVFDPTGGPAAPDVFSQFMKDSSEGGSGSAMNLTFGTGHQPVFVTNPAEGVELKSSIPPAGNENSAGVNVTDIAHVECTDCHNPHQVTGPRFSSTPNRMRGMKGIDIHGKVVGPNVLGNDRQVYIYEVCFRCHGNSYSQMFAGDAYPNDTVYRSSDFDLTPYQDLTLGVNRNINNPALYGSPKQPVNSKMSFSGFSNKRKEFDPDSTSTAQGLDTLGYNSAFHPVFQPGRNQSEVFDNTLLPNAEHNAFDPASGLAASKTIMCTDCHNTSDIGDVKGPVTTSSPSDIRVGAGAGSLLGSNINRNDLLQGNVVGGNDVISNKAVGPHGSDYKRILRGDYNTRSSSECNGNAGDDCRYKATNDPAFAVGGVIKQPYQNDLDLCFRCHNKEVFITGSSNATNFYARYDSIDNNIKYDTLPIVPGTDIWQGNLHYLHINFSDAKCHDCHNNIHSNIEAPNTIYGNHNGDCTEFFSGNSPQFACNPGGLVPNYNRQDDGPASNCALDDRCNKTSTHLVNFNPVSVAGNQSSKPRWYYGKNKWENSSQLQDTTKEYMNCDLRCHGRTMNECAYQYEIKTSILTANFFNCVQ